MFEHEFKAGVAWLRASGDVDVEGWRHAVASLLSDPRFRTGMPILYDARAATPLAPGTSADFADALRVLTRPSPVAIVTADGVAYGVARQIAIRADGDVEAFADVPAAMQFLAIRHLADAP